MKKISFIAALGALSLLCGCMDFSELLKTDIEPPVRPVANFMPTVIDVKNEIGNAEWYNEFYNSVLSGNEYTIVSEHVTNDDVGMALNMIHTEHPEISWLGNMYSASTATDGSRINLDFQEDFNSNNIPKILDELEEAAEKVIEGIPTGSSDYEKILYVHDYIIENTTYDYEAANTSNIGICGTAYGCLINGEAVCSGYAAAFQYIMLKLGIESGICTGSNHAWNYVKVDNEYYWLDATWDDYDRGKPNHTYFLISTEQLLNTRTFDRMQYHIPECTSAENNYFVKSGGYFEEFSEDTVIDYVSSCSDEGRCEMMFGSYEAYAEALDSLIAYGKIRKADGVSSGDLSYYRNDDMFTLEIMF